MAAAAGRRFSSLPFVWAALLAAAVPGFGLGSVLFAALLSGQFLGPWWVAAAQAHGHAQVFGFAGLMVYGVAFYFLPRLRGAPLAAPHLLPVVLWLSGGGPLLRVLGQQVGPLVALHLGPAAPLPMVLGGALAVSGPLELAGGTLAIGLLARTGRRGPPLRTRAGVLQVLPLLVAAWIGLWLALALNATGTVDRPGRLCPAVVSTDPVSDDLWEAIQPLLPPEPARHHGGPPRVPHRAALSGILFILRHGLRWRDLPQELGYGSGVTCWRRLRQWQELGIWATVHQVVLNWLGALDALDWSRASVDSISVRAKRSGEHTGPNPTERGKQGSKDHFLVDRQGVPLAVQLTAANVHDSKLLEPLVDAVQPIRRPTGEPGRSRKRPAKLHADKAYDFGSARRALRQRGITPRIARRGVESSERLGRVRWVVERTQAWVVAFRKLAIRYDRHAASVIAFLHLACALICLRFLAHAEAAAH